MKAKPQTHKEYNVNPEMSCHKNTQASEYYAQSGRLTKAIRKVGNPKFTAENRIIPISNYHKNMTVMDHRNNFREKQTKPTS